jgi:integrase
VGNDAVGEVVAPFREAPLELEGLEQEGEGKARGTRFVREQSTLRCGERPGVREVIRWPLVLHAGPRCSQNTHTTKFSGCNRPMERSKRPATEAVLRAQSSEAQSLRLVVEDTVKLWRKHHLTYDQTKQVVAQVRRALQLSAPRPRRRTVERLDRAEVAALIDAAYRRSSRHGLLVKTLFYTGHE